MEKIFTIIVVFAAVFFLYNKVKTWRTPESLVKRIYQTKANMSLGVFLVAFGANLLFGPRGTVDIVVGVIFGLLGAANVLFGFKAYQHYAPQLDGK